MNYVFGQSLLIDEKTQKAPPPYYIYLLATTQPELKSEKNADTITVETVFSSFLRYQYKTWIRSCYKIEEADLSPLLNKAKEILTAPFSKSSNMDHAQQQVSDADIMKITYGVQALLMALSNIERELSGTTLKWAGATKKTLLTCLFYSEYWQRKTNRYYNEQDMKANKLWMQCGGFRYLASIANSHSDPQDSALPKIEFGTDTADIFKDWLDLEASTGNRRFYFMLTRMLEYSNFYEYYEKTPITLHELSEDQVDTVFMQYDNMKEWMKNHRK